MFLLNSRLSLFSAPLVLPRGPLIPKLRGQLAEFLNEGSPERLGTLVPAYQWRFAVRALNGLGHEAFLDGRITPSRIGLPLHFPPAQPLRGWIYLPPGQTEGRTMSIGCAGPFPPCPPEPLKRPLSGAGMLTCYPSPSAKALCLGPD